MSQLRSAWRYNRRGGGAKRPISPPAGFSWTPPFKLYRNGNTITVDPGFSLQAYAGIAVAKTYYVTTVGNDADTGVDEAHALRRVSTALGKTDVDRVYVKAGTYEYTYGWDGTSPNRNLEVIGYGGEVHLSQHIPGLGWVLDTTHYEAACASTGINVVDTSVPDAYGDGIPLTYQTSEALVEANAGSWWWSAGVFYVRTLDDRAPDADILCFVTTGGNGLLNDAVTYYIEGLHFDGGARSFQAVSASSSAKLYAKNCTFRYGRSGASTRDSLYVSGCGEVIAQNCVVARSSNDGFHFEVNTVSANVALLGCTGRNLGYAGLTACNHSSRHDAAPIIRVNCEGFDIYGPTVRDIGAGGMAWLLGCNMYNPATPATNYVVNGGGGAAMWLDTCISAGGLADISADAGSTMYYYNMTPAAPSTAGAGTFTPYTP